MNTGSRIVIVDDVPSVLQLLTHVVRNSTNCEVVGFTSPQAALEYLHDHPASCVLSDFRMPGMDGAHFLSVIQEEYPNTVRLAISGEPESASDLQLASAAHQFFHKPDDINKLASRIERIFKLKEKLPSHGLDHLVSQVKTLPTPPALVIELDAALNKPEPSLDEIGRILEKDLALSAKVLQLCNSAIFGFREHVMRPRHAVAMLGINLVRSLALAFHTFKRESIRTSRNDQNALFTHSLSVASSSQNIATIQGVSANNREEFFIAGLFHDIGKVVLAANAPETWSNIFDIATRDRRPAVDVERELLGATHAETGAYLLGLWGFSDSVVMAAAYHHNPSACPSDNQLVLAAVHAANVFDHHDAVTSYSLDQNYLKKLNLADRVDAWRSFGRATTP